MEEQANEHSQLIDSIYQINAHLQAFEKKYGLASATFTSCSAKGRLMAANSSRHGISANGRDFTRSSGSVKRNLQP